MSTTDNPVTHTAEVAVKRQVNTEKTAPLCLEKGRHNNSVPINMTAVKNNIIALTGDEFIF
jgi:hypothetical protein